MTFSTNKHPWNLNEYAQREIAVYVSVYLCLSIWDINNVSLFFSSPFFINYFCQDNTAEFLLYVTAKSKVWINVIKEHLSFGVRLCKKKYPIAKTFPHWVIDHLVETDIIWRGYKPHTRTHRHTPHRPWPIHWINAHINVCETTNHNQQIFSSNYFLLVSSLLCVLHIEYLVETSSNYNIINSNRRLRFMLK